MQLEVWPRLAAAFQQVFDGLCLGNPSFEVSHALESLHAQFMRVGSALVR